MNKNNATALISFIALTFLVIISISHIIPPDAVAESAPAEEFSSGRAMKHLRTIAQRPHPIGSPENAAVREYLLSELRSLGLNPEVQTGVGSNEERQIAGTVHNVLARMPGTANSRAVMLACHYDSVPTGPGAGDDGAAVAAMLETAKALKSGPPLRNDVIFLFTDGEESGLLGAAAFVDEHPWKQDVGAVFNFEARGSRGPSLMFETSDENGRLIREFAQSDPYAKANSLMFEAYKRLPNDTDMTFFKRAGLNGLNFAFLGGHTEYHTQMDSPEIIDERSLMHHGLHMLSVARRFGNIDLNDIKEPNAVYFDLPVAGLIHYPETWVLPIALFAVILFAAAIAFGLRNKRLKLSGMLFGMLLFLLSLIPAPLIVHLLWRGALTLHSSYRTIPQGDTYNSHYYLLAFVALTVGIFAAIYGYARKKIAVFDLLMGAQSLWLALLIAASLITPGASFYFAWPLIFSLIAAVYAFSSKEEDFAGTGNCIAICIGAAPAMLLWPAFINLIFITLTPRMAALTAILTGLLLGLLIPHIAIAARLKERMLPAFMLSACVVLLLIGSLTSGFDSLHRKPNNIFYVLNADTQKAYWTTTDEAVDEWTSQFFASGAQKGKLSDLIPISFQNTFWFPSPNVIWSSPDAIEIPPPSIEKLEDAQANGIRRLRLRVASPRKASLMTIYIDESADARSASINGKPMKPSRGALRLRYSAPPVEGVELKLEVGSSQPIKISVVDRTFELPQLPGQPFKPRPDYMMPAPFGLTDSTLVAKTFEF